MRGSWLRAPRAFGWAVRESARGRRKVGRTHDHGPQGRSLLLLPNPVRSVRERTLASQASSPSHLLLACRRGLRRAAVRTAGPGTRSGFPEVSEHALGWLLCGVRVGGLVLTHSLLAESFLFMNEKSSG